MSEDGGDDDNDSITPRIDLSDRYEETLRIQVDSIKNFDNKIWRSMRLTGIISGVSIGVISFLSSNGGNGGQMSISLPAQLSLSLSIVVFIISLAFGIRSYKSIKLATAPKAVIGHRLEDETTSVDSYKQTIVENYSTAIDHNNESIKEKRDNYRQVLFTLFIGISGLAIGLLLLIWSPETNIGFVISILGVISSVCVAYFSIYCDEDEDETQGTADTEE